LILAMHYALRCAMHIFGAKCNIIKYRGDIMAFQLRENRKETENKTIRFPAELIDKIEDAIKNQNVTFSSFVIQACEYALNDMVQDK